jgi:uncharacterized protein YggE
MDHGEANMRLVTAGVVALLLSGCGPQAHSLTLADTALQRDITDLAEAIVNRKTVTVSGDGTVRVPPDTATVTVGLEQKGKDANEAQNKVNVAGKAVIDAWKAAGIPEKSIQTVGLDLYPDYARPESTGIEVLVGYRAVMRLQARTVPDSPGVLVDAALASGANRLEGVVFSREDDQAARKAAIAKAMNKAMSEARAALGTLELTVKEVQKIDIGSGASQPMFNYGGGMAMERASAAPTPVAPGELEVRAMVTVVVTF